MGLRSDLQADLAEAFDDEDGLADAVKPFTCSKTVQSGEYDVDTGTYPEITVTLYEGRGIFGDYSAMEADGTNILITDTELTVLQSELIRVDGDGPTDELATPAVDDEITGNGLKYRVVNWGQDPASVTFSIQLRAS